ncbi:hypothetical protein K439DRAFT_1630534 [Ramaria rubella]|nr:hypothetical protein K439DRAFT_1641893 [Ramaria rubella]KAF8587547.1 hypothetical protein K439DRAFT_1630534 [Ramaria rubella]
MLGIVLSPFVCANTTSILQRNTAREQPVPVNLGTSVRVRWTKSTSFIYTDIRKTQGTEYVGFCSIDPNPPSKARWH